MREQVSEYLWEEPSRQGQQEVQRRACRKERKIWVYEAVVGGQLQVGFLSQGLTTSLHSLRSMNIMNIVSQVNSPAHWTLDLQT